MKRQVAFWLTIVLVAAALVASAILLVDYVRPAPVFCEAGGGCSKVSATAFARPLGVPLPAIGLLGLLAIGFSALLPGARARQAQLVLAGVGGLVAAALFVVQARLHALCPYCAVVDGASIVLVGLAVARWKNGWDPPAQRPILGAAVGGLLLAIGVPLALGFSRRTISPDVPPPVLAEMKRTGGDKVTVVDFVDFECRYCRATHANLGPLLAERKDKVRVARKHVPLRMHPHALDAAKAACCAETLGKGEEMADALFTAPVDDLTPEGCEKLAKELGLDVEQLRRCVSDPMTAARIENDKAEFRAAKGHGLPLIWVGETELDGAKERHELEAALDGEIRRL